MDKVFLGFAFRQEDRDLAGYVEDLLASHDIRMITGEHLGGNQLTDAVKAQIDKVDALIALLTCREQFASGGWATHQWVLDEISYARSRNIPAIAIVENGVKLEGAYVQHEYIPLEKSQPLPTFLKLSQTIHAWKQEIGDTAIVQIQPEDAAEFASQYAESVKCQYRFFHEGDYTDWKEAKVAEAPGGTLIYIKGVKPNCSVQVTMSNQQTVWQSKVEPQWVRVFLVQRR